MPQLIPNQALKETLKKNSLFNGLLDDQLNTILSVSKKIAIKKNETLITENEISDNIYIILKGKVEVYKQRTAAEQEHLVAVLGTNAVIGEMGLLDNSPRSASVRTLKDTTLLVFSIKALQTLSENTFFPLIMQNLTALLGERIRSTNERVVDGLRRELVHAKARIAMGLVTVNVLITISLYTIILKVLDAMQINNVLMSIISVLIIVMFSLACFYIIHKSRYPLKTFGITFKNWRPSIIKAIYLTVALIIITILIKYIAINIFPSYKTRYLFDGYLFNNFFSHRVLIFILPIYMLFIPLQEFVTRGLLQSSFEKFLIGPHKVLIAIFLSNLLFSVSHLHLDFKGAIAVFLVGLSWGWLYSKYHTLVGVIFSHLIMGVWALYILGI